VAPTCRQWEELVRCHQTRFVLSFDFEREVSRLWEDEAAVAALGPALARRPALPELDVHSLDYVRAHVRQAGMLGDYAEDLFALEPAAAELLGFVAGRMPTLQSLHLRFTAPAREQARSGGYCLRHHSMPAGAQRSAEHECATTASRKSLHGLDSRNRSTL